MMLSFGQKACAHATAVNPLHLEKICYLCLIEQSDKVTPAGLL